MAYTARLNFKSADGFISYRVSQDGTTIGDFGSSSAVIDEAAKTCTVTYLGEPLLVSGYPFAPATTPPPASTNTEPAPWAPKLNAPLNDNRLIWNYPFGPEGSGESIAGIYSWNTDAQIETTEGILEEEGEGESKKIITLNQKADTSDRKDLYGVPSIMNPHAYLVLSPTNDNSQSNALLVDVVDDANRKGKLWYESGLDVTSYRANEPTTTSVIQWSREPMNEQRVLKFSDFAFCKYWKKIPNNYMITLRRFAFPTNDSLTFPDEDTMKPQYKIPVATMVTWMGEATGNSIGNLLSFEAGMNWGELKSDVWEQQAPDAPGADDSPFGLGGTAKLLGLFSGQANLSGTAGQTPLDPYDGGPYANKIIGPIDVIQRVAKRERGLMWKQELNVIFEYEARSIGGANTKAIMMDILGNMLLMTTNSAFFWGGQNRMKPGATPKYPFLGGKEGLQAFYNGDAAGFFGAVANQFTAALGNLGDMFGKILSGDFASVLTGLANTAVKQASAGKRPQIAGIRSLLTGDNVGEWHLTIGNPMNPMMVAGNLVCKGIKVEFGEELGPDDFPTEIKATITLEHGMDRDRDRAAGMFNFGSGRVYALPKGFQSSFSTTKQSSIDNSTKNAGAADPKYHKAGTASPSRNAARRTGTGGGGNKNPLLGDPQDVDRVIKITRETASKAFNTFGGIWGMGEGSRVGGPNKPDKK